MMFFGWMAGVLLVGIVGAGLVAAPSRALAANSTKPREIVVVGSKLKKKSGGEMRAGDTLIDRWQRSRSRPKSVKSK
jgi:hypothetical protein